MLAVIMFLVGYLCMRLLEPNVLRRGGKLFNVTYTDAQSDRMNTVW